MKCVIYTRVSTGSQAQDGASLETQKSKAELWAKVNDYEVVGSYEDAGISGCKASNRPGLQAALDQACKENAALIVYSLSRLARSTKDALQISERLDKAGADLVSLSEKIETTSAAGKMVFRLLSVLAEFERDLISERTKNVLSHLKGQSRRVSKEIPYGYNLIGDHLVPNENEQEIIREIIELRARGLSLRMISLELAKRHVRTKTGKDKWAPKVIADIIKREDAA